MKKLLFVSVLTLMSVIVASAQTTKTTNKATNKSASTQTAKITVKGTVVDSKSGEKMIGALISIVGTDKGGISNAKGEFSIFGVDKGKPAKIEISYVGYKNQTITINSNENIYNIPNPIKLEIEGMNIKDIVVQSDAPAAQIKGDTTVFNAAAYKINPDATAGDLLAKMPGFEKNDDGSVSAQGDKVQRIFVDGKSFFKNDLATALNSLPADAVENIEMFDDKSDRSKFTGFDDGSKVRTINIITKNKLKNAIIAEGSLGYGFDDKYIGSANFSYFTDKKQLSVVGGANNINSSPTGERGRGMRRGGGSSGINTQQGVGITFSNTLKNEGELAVSYRFSGSENMRKSLTNRFYFPTAEYNNRTYNSLDSSNNKSYNHNFTFDLKTNIGENTQITFRPTGSFSDANNYSKSYNNSIIDQDTTRSDRVNRSTSNNYSYGGALNVMRKFSQNSFFTVDLNANFQNNNSDSYLKGITYYEKLAAEENDEVEQNQKSENLSNTSSVSANAEYTQRLTRTMGLSFSYEFGYNWSDNDKRTYIYDELQGKYVDLDEDLSNHFQRDYMTNNAGVRYNYKTDETTINFALKYQNAQMENEKLFPEPTYKKPYSFDGALVNFDYRYRKTKEGGSVNVSYSGRPNYPSVSQLQDVMNNDNPLQLSSGNPNLKQSFQNNFELSYRGGGSWEKGKFWRVYSRISNTMNGVVNNTTLYDRDSIIPVGGVDYEVRKGAQYTQPTNMNGSWNASVGGMYSFPLDVIKTKINFMGSYQFSNLPSLYNSIKYKSTTNTVSFNVGFNSNISQNIDFSVNNSITYRDTKSERTQNNSSFTDNLRVNVYWNIWNGIFVTGDYTMTYRKYNTPLDKPFTNMMNAAVGKKFAKDRWEVRASVFDAINQSTSIEQQINDIYIADVFSNNLTRYYSLTLTYRFNSMKNMSKDGMRRPGMGGFGGQGGGHGGFGGRATTTRMM